MIDYSGLKKKTVPFSVVSFDIFDTLLKRKVKKPSDVFTIAYGKWFYYFRILAEVLARKTAKTEDIDMDDIYRFLKPFDKNREIETEFSLSTMDEKMVELAKRIKKDGKKIFAVSDMYLPKSVIEKLLEKTEIDFDGIYVSSEYRCSKVTGNLFRKFLENENLKPNEVLHIGDNPVSDGKGAEKAGIKAAVISENQTTAQRNL